MNEYLIVNKDEEVFTITTTSLKSAIVAYGNNFLRKEDKNFLLMIPTTTGSHQAEYNRYIIKEFNSRVEVKLRVKFIIVKTRFSTYLVT